MMKWLLIRLSLSLLSISQLANILYLRRNIQVLILPIVCEKMAEYVQFVIECIDIITRTEKNCYATHQGVPNKALHCGLH
jgi:hypothetical protein